MLRATTENKIRPRHQPHIYGEVDEAVAVLTDIAVRESASLVTQTQLPLRGIYGKHIRLGVC
jgi:hypothetical protein